MHFFEPSTKLSLALAGHHTSGLGRFPQSSNARHQEDPVCEVIGMFPSSRIAQLPATVCALNVPQPNLTQPSHRGVTGGCESKDLWQFSCGMLVSDFMDKLGNPTCTTSTSLGSNEATLFVTVSACLQQRYKKTEWRTQHAEASF